MRALCKTSAGPGAELVAMPPPRIGKDEVLIKVRRASICGSDMPVFHWNSWAPSRIKPPMVFGHEFCGEVARTGSGVLGLIKGDFVSVESHIFCGSCVPCRNGQQHVCQDLKIIGIDCPGGFAEYARVPARCAWKHPNGAFRDVGSLFEPLGNAVYATLVEDVKGHAVLVTGCGPQGLFAVAVAKASGASRVVAVEGSPFRRRLARRMGADAVIDPADPDALSRALRAGGPRARRGFDAVLEMSGAAAAVDFGLQALRNGGRLTAFGIPSAPLTLHWDRDIVFKGIRVYGIAGREIYRTWQIMERLLKTKAIDIRPVITHVYPLKDFRKAFETMSSPEKKCGKVVLELDN